MAPAAPPRILYCIHHSAAARTRQAGRHDDLSASIASTPASCSQPAGGAHCFDIGRSEAFEEAREGMTRPTLEVADILRACGSSFLERHGSHLASQHRKVMDAIVRCRTAALGGHLDRCSGCGHQAISCNSCRQTLLRRKNFGSHR